MGPIDRTPPQPPIPPPHTLICGCCGYKAPEPEYNHICWTGVAMVAALAAVVVIVLASAFVNIYTNLGS